MLKIIGLSKDKVRNLSTIEATFQIDGELVPLKVSEEDRPDVYLKINKLITAKDVDIEAVAEELYALMSPSAGITKEIKNSRALSGKLELREGSVYFGDFRLEDALASHMLSLLSEDNVPKDETLWKSYVRFLDNLHQNVSEDIRTQLFRWMNYERAAGNPFGITEDGCIVGYKGCNGTVINPVSVHSGFAIVDGVEMNGTIPNQVGSVITMPRSEVQFDPGVGCSYGLHVGTKDYAKSWAPILLRVKVNPRDVVSVPYECESQKMRVCEYTVLEVTQPTDSHKMFFKDPVVKRETLVSLEDVEDLRYEEVFVEYDDGESAFTGTVVDIYEGYEPGIIVKNDDGEYKHIKLYRINYLEELSPEDGGDDDEGCCPSFDEYDTLGDLLDETSNWPIDRAEVLDMVGKEIYVEYGEGKSFEGVVTSIFDDQFNPGLIMRNADEHKHIKLDRINHWVEKIAVEADEVDKNDELYIAAAKMSTATVVHEDTVNGRKKVVVTIGRVVFADLKNRSITVETSTGDKKEIGLETVLSIDIAK